MQLNRYLALCGVASRRKANMPIKEGRVQVNEETITELGKEVDSEKDRITIDGKPLKAPKQYRYVLLNKPAGVITSRVDGRGRDTVFDVVKVKERIFPVGRLDYDTTGVLLLTNDGDLAHRLAHPSFEIDKIYETWVEGRVSLSEIRKLEKGVEIDPDVIVSGDAEILKQEENRTLVRIRIHQGKKRQIKRMMKNVGHPVIQLERTCFAGLTTEGVLLGANRDLTSHEVETLYRLTRLNEGL